MVRKRRIEIWRRPIATITDPVITPNARWLYLSPKWWNLVQSLIGEMEQPSYWIGTNTDIQTTIKRILEIEAQNIKPPPAQPPAQPPVIEVPTLEDILSEYSEDEILEALECLDMACNCKDLAKLFRVTADGTLQVWSSIDNCGCMGWVSIGNFSGGGATGGAIGGAIGGGLIDAQGNPVSGVTIPTKTTDINSNQSALRLCSRATQMIDIFILMMETAIYADSIIDDIDDVLPFDFRAAYNSVNQYLGGLGVPAASFVLGDIAISVVRNIQNAVIGEFIDWIAEKTINRAEAICILYSALKSDEEIVGEDIAAGLHALALSAEAYAAMVTLLQGFEIAGLKELYDTYAGDIECGCPDLVDMLITPPPSEVEPTEPYDWARLFDFEVDDWGISLSALDGGVYEAGVGIRGTIVGWGNGSSFGIGANKNTGGSANVTSFDIYFDYANTSENPTNPQNDNNKMQIKIPASDLQAIIPKNQWSSGFYRWEGNKTGVGVEVRWWAGWDNTAPINITGHIIIKKFVIRGLGTDTFLSLPEEQRGVLL